MQKYLICNVKLVVMIIKNSLVKSCFINVIKKNILIDLLLVFAVCGSVIASLIPPQILKYVIDNKTCAKKR